MNFRLAAALWLLLQTTGVFAQFGSDNSDVISINPFLSVDQIRPGDKFKVGLEATLLGNWHINSNQPAEDFLIPTRLSMTTDAGVVFGDVNYPVGMDIKFAFSETPLSVYEGKVVFWLEAEAVPDLRPGEITLGGTFRYQACNDMTCLIPTEESFEITVPVVSKGAPVNPINADKFIADAGEIGALAGERASGENEISKLVAGQGLMLALVFIFVGGLALNLTPCVYPIIPITLSFFVSQSSGKLRKSVSLALLYVIGMAITYSALGVTAAMTGGLLGSSLQNPVVLIAIAGIFVIFAASMFGAFEIRVPSFLNRVAGGSRQGHFGALLMGLTVGIVAAPCIGPFVISLLTYVAAQGDPLMGFLMFFVLSLGLGLPYFVLGSFSGSIEHLPRSGEWMIWIKKIFGVIMIAVAIYFLNSLLPNLAYIGALTATLIIGGFFIGFRDRSRASFQWFRNLKYATGSIFILVGSWNVFSAWAEANAPQLDWQAFAEERVIDAQTDGKPVLIDFYADWCIPCKQIDKKLFRAPVVIAGAKNFVALKADLTAETSPEIKKLRQKYRVHGVPTVILLDKAGHEYKRFTDELVKLKPEEFATVIREASRAAGE